MRCPAPAAVAVLEGAAVQGSTWTMLEVARCRAWPAPPGSRGRPSPCRPRRTRRRGSPAGRRALRESTSAVVQRDDRLLVLPWSLSRTASSASRGGVPAASTAFAGSARLDRDEAHPLTQSRTSRRLRPPADLVPVSGSSGFVVMDGAANGIRGYSDWLPGWTPRRALAVATRRHSPLRPAARQAPKARRPYGPLPRRCASAASRIIDRTTNPFAGGYRRVLGVIAAPPGVPPPGREKRRPALAVLGEGGRGRAR